MSRKFFGPPKGGWPTDVMVPSERIARVTARLKPVVDPRQAIADAVMRGFLEGRFEMEKQRALSRKQLFKVLDE
jgi:hypothetical protein